MGEFLSERDFIGWSAPEGFPALLDPAGLFTQDAPHGLEVALAESPRKPTAPDLRRAWAKRRAGRVSPVLVVARYPTTEGERVSLCGPAGDPPIVQHGVEVSQAERLAGVALDEPNRHAATRFLLAHLPELDQPMPGLRNVGLLSTQELEAGVPQRSDWPEAGRRARPLLGLRGRPLAEGLGFGVNPLSTNTSMLTIGGLHRAIAVFCDEDEPFDAPAQRFEGATPVSRALAVADQQAVDWVILTRSAEIRLYAARADTGVGRKGRAETFMELNLSLLPDDLAGYLHLLFSADALAEDGTLGQILDRSADFAAKLAVRLRERVYFQTVPALASAVARRLGRDPDEASLDDAYQKVMVILFRLLFVAYAEDKDLLPYRTNDHYAHHSLKRLARRLAEDRRAGRERYDDQAASLWDDVRQLWEAVNRGNTGWGVPAYNGGLFTDDPAVSEPGAALTELRLTDAELAPALAELLIDESPEGAGPVDFRSLSVREFGTIYEGLLESRLSVAQSDLTVKKAKGQAEYVPASGSDPVEVSAGAVYVHNRSGARKATGSYFTKPFAVTHLLDYALKPALDNHIARLEELKRAGDDAALADAFFDFRCADIAMGSGHFLVAALDRIEARLSGWLALNPVPAVTAELQRLRKTAVEALGDLAAGVEVETSSLLRRQVARHCIYGVDRNQVAVELARLAVWVHTFVPGLPLSFLDHNLVCGDSLTGVGNLDEAAAAFEPEAEPDAPSLYRSQLEELLAAAESALRRLARTSDATKREIDEARTAHQDAQRAVAGARALFDLITAQRAGACTLPEHFDESVFIREAAQPGVGGAVESLAPLHFPAAFPEVFLRERPGFDCLLGNPPWEKVMVELKVWWGRHIPGVRSWNEREMNDAIEEVRRSRPDLEALYNSDIDRNDQTRAVLMAGPYPGIGRSHPDLYKAFAWRNWHLARPETGHVGIVLPRTAFADHGMATWRQDMLQRASLHLTTLRNKGHWVFDDVHQQYQVVLVSIHNRQTNTEDQPKAPPLDGTLLNRPEADQALALTGPFHGLVHYRTGMTHQPQQVPVDEFITWTSNAAVPMLPSDQALRVFRKMRQHPRFDGSPTDNGLPSRLDRLQGSLGQSRAVSGSLGQSRAVSGEVPAASGTQRHDRSGPVPSGDQSRWQSRLVWEFDAGKDKVLFVRDAGAKAVRPGSDFWPVYTGKSFNLWNPDTGEYSSSADPDTVTAALQQKRRNGHRIRRSAFSEVPAAWIEDPDTLPCLRPRIAVRDTTNSTNTRTVIAALVPGELVITHQAPYLLRIKGTEKDEAFLIGVLSSMILDWYARRVVELHLTASILDNFPIPAPDLDNDPTARRTVEIAGRLAAVDDRFSEWAAAVGVPVGSANDEPTKSELICELDACVARLYGLDEDDLAVIYDTFHEGADYSDRLAAVLAHFRRLP